MIIIDGRESAHSLANYANLEEVLVKIMEEDSMEQRIVTDVLVDGESFSELYPHQAEDIEAADIGSVEVRTVSVEQMAADVAEELPKVIDIMASGSRRSAALLRAFELQEGLEVLQDIISVSRDLLNTIHVLRSNYSPATSTELDALGDTLGDLLGEVGDAMENEDWILVADLIEYEYLPACEGWRTIIDAIASDIPKSKAA
ncbi:hypothetical protein LJC59_09060 [Desulfovibrio sp. OttesenSCG-928-A18]|nr:hypothetical protein [Desulfovibrio sp. OttesenSCG-928-A18]